MTQQFKFGDRIRNALVPNLTFIYIRQDSPTTCICLDETAQEKRMIATDMELVPHPDTVRLDWLADRDNHIGNVQLPAECVACNLHSLRAAIDMAMRMQPENAETQEEAV